MGKENPRCAQFGGRAARVSRRKAVCFRKILALAELEALAGAGLARLFPLFHARIAREEAFGLQRGAMLGVGFRERAGDGEPDRAGLAIRPPPGAFTETSKCLTIFATSKGCSTVFCSAVVLK